MAPNCSHIISDCNLIFLLQRCGRRIHIWTHKAGLWKRSRRHAALHVNTTPPRARLASEKQRREHITALWLHLTPRAGDRELMEGGAVVVCESAPLGTEPDKIRQSKSDPCQHKDFIFHEQQVDLSFDTLGCVEWLEWVKGNCHLKWSQQHLWDNI